MRAVTAPFIAAIPLKPRTASADWQVVQANLRRTIRSVRAAARGLPVTVVVACHDEPDLGDEAAGVELVRAPFAEPEDAGRGGRDKARKRRLIGAWLRDWLTVPDAYVMFLDADDLVHRNLISSVLTGGRDSYLVESGYVFDRRARVLTRRARAFSATCGSSFICRFEPGDLPTSWDDREAPYSRFGSSTEEGGRGHTEYHLIAAELGRPAGAIDFPAVLYMVNHSESLWSARFNQLRSVPDPRNVVVPRVARRVLTDEFTAPDLAGELAGLAHMPTLILRRSRARVRGRVRR
jgi:hypothetical protein